MRGEGIDKDDRTNESDDEEGKRQSKDENGLLPGRHVGVLLFVGGRGWAPWEEDEKEEHARKGQPGVEGDLSTRVAIHEEEAGPLHADLRNAQERSGAREATYLAAAGHVGGALGQGQDVGDAGGAGDGAQQHKHGAEAAGGAACDDLAVLREVRDQYAGDDEAGGAGG